MKHREARSLAQILARSATFVGLAFVLLAPSSSGQESPAPVSTAHLTFDAASIRERKPGDTENIVVGMRQTPGRITNACATLTQFIYFAFNFSWSAPIENLPKWASAPCGGGSFSNTYKFEATLPADGTPEQTREMMRSLLADRFKFAYHWESRSIPVYALVLAEGGFKLKPYDANTDKPIYGSQFFCPQEDPGCRSIALQGPVSTFAKFLSRPLGRPVVDQTGLTGDYQFGFNWAGDVAVESPLPSLPSVLRDKFGLELKPINAPIDVLVIDHVEPPTPN